MKKIGFVITLFIAFSTSVFANQANTQYFGVDYLFGYYDEAGFSTAEPNALRFKIGHYFTDNVAVEAQYAMGVADDTVSGVTVEIDHAISILARGELPISDNANFYGVVGYTDGELTGSVPGFSVSVSDSGLSYGVGFDFGIAKGTFINIDYMSYLDESDYDFTAFSIGIKKNF